MKHDFRYHKQFIHTFMYSFISSNIYSSRHGARHMRDTAGKDTSMAEKGEVNKRLEGNKCYQRKVVMYYMNE